MLRKFRQRSKRLEHLDTGDYTAEEYEGCIKELQLVNKWLGDAHALRHSLLTETERAGLQRLSILDVGAGSGELLRVAVKWCRQTKRVLHATGLELNERSAKSIKEESVEFKEIDAVRADALRLPFPEGAVDYVMSSLFTHHFSDDQVVLILKEMQRVAARGIFVIDLHRHPIAYFFYTTVARLLLRNRLVREDGALSILRSFKPAELRELAGRAGLEDISVRRHFPYRLVLSARVNRLTAVSVSQQTQENRAA